MTRWRLAGIGAMLAVLLCFGTAAAEFSLNGYLMSQTGIFTATDVNKLDGDGYPKEHGGNYGKLSMFRNTLQLEADYSPTSKINLHAVFRGVRSASLAADSYAQVPTFFADKTFNEDEEVQEAKRKWVQETYYTENDLRELFLDVEATDWLSFRIGRQQVSWGETGSFALLDVVNPSNTTWHLGPFEAFEDTRVPLWMLKTLIDVPPMQGNLELLWIPLIDKPENTVTTPLTFAGAWGLPVAPKPAFLSSLTIEKKELIYPDNDLSDSRLGVRWKGTAGPVTYTALYYYTHQISPPIPSYVEKDAISDPATGLSNTEVFLEFPRQHITGFSLDYAIPRPISTVFRLESAYYPDKPFSVNSFLEPGRFPDGIRDWKPSPNNPDTAKAGQEGFRLRNYMHHEERDVINYAAVLFRPNQIRWLNPKNSIYTQFQIFQSIMLEDPMIEEKVNGEWVENENWYMTSIPGYDTSRVNQVQTLLVFAALTSYWHGLFNPMVVAVWVLPKDQLVTFSDGFDMRDDWGSGFLSAKFRFTLGNHWRLETGVNQIFGYDPYVNLGLFRDRDEVYSKVAFQF
jgi:Protein of unknown function (DUF1302)